MAAPAPQGPLRRRRRRVSLAVLGKRAVEVFRAEEEAGVARGGAGPAEGVGESQRSAPRPAGTVREEEEEAARDPRTRERGARPGEEAVLRAVAAACAEIKVQTKVSSNARFHTGGDGGPRPMRACGGGAPRGGGGGRA